MCEGLVTIEECTLAIDKMKQNKSPGLDGLTVEFYQAFWPLLGNFLIGVYNEIMNSFNLNETFLHINAIKLTLDVDYV